MFFKNATIFTFPTTTNFNDLEAGLEECALKPLNGLEMSTRGFVPPLGDGATSLCYRSGNHLWLAVGGEDRILPGGVVMKKLAEKLKEIEEKEGRKPGGRTRKALKDEIITDLIPKAFTKQMRCDVYLNLDSGICIVDSASRKVAEQAVSELRRALGSFPALPSNAELAPSSVLSGMFNGELPEDLSLGLEVELKDVAGGGVIRASKEDLHSEDLRRHMESGRIVSKLGLTLGDRIEFVACEDLSIRKIKFVGEFEDVPEREADSLEQELAARFELFHPEINALYQAMRGAFKLTSPDGVPAP